MTPLLKDLQDQIVVVEPKRPEPMDFVLSVEYAEKTEGAEIISDDLNYFHDKVAFQEALSAYNQALSAYHKHFPTRDLEWKKDASSLKDGTKIYIDDGDQIYSFVWCSDSDEIHNHEKYCLPEDYEPDASYESLNNCLGEGWEKIEVEGYEERWKHTELGITLDFDGDYFYLSKKGLLAQWHESICKPEHINSIIKDIENAEV